MQSYESYHRDAETTNTGESILRSTKNVLKGKDPDACSLVDGESEPVNPITFDGLETILEQETQLPE